MTAATCIHIYLLVDSLVVNSDSVVIYLILVCKFYLEIWSDSDIEYEGVWSCALYVNGLLLL